MKLTPEAKQRIRDITLQLVMDLISKGELDTDDREAMRAATEEAAGVARKLYFAAEEFLS